MNGKITGLGDLEKSHGASGQEAIIRERPGVVTLDLSASLYGAAMTPEQARFLAKMLIEAAKRVEEMDAQ